MKTLFTIFLSILTFGLIQAQTFTNYTDADGLINNGVNCLDVAPGDVMWFGTQAGVSVFDGNAWTTHSTSTDVGFVDDVVTALKVLSNGDVWIGSDFGAAHYDGSFWTTYTESDGLGDDRIRVIHEDLNGSIWFGTNAGITKFDGSAWTSWGTAEGLPFGGVTSIDEQPFLLLHLGSALGGVTIFINGFSSEITENEGLLNDKVRSNVTDISGNHWIGTSDGISVFNNSNQLIAQHTTMFTLPAPDTLNPVEDIVIDSQGNIWAGVYVDYLVTEGGITAYNGSEWTQFDVSDGLIGPVVRQLAVDGQDNIWVATSTGISKISDVDLGGGNGIFNPQVNKLDVYPNPATDQITIELPTGNNVAEFEIFDASLRSVRSKSIDRASGTVQVSVADLKTGIYMARVGNSVSLLVIE